MATTEENREIAFTFFEHLNAGDLDKALTFLHDDIVWWVVGKPEQFPLAGDHNKKQFVEMLESVHTAMPSGVLLTLTSSTAENERVIIEAESRGTSPAGEAYDNSLVYVLEFRDGKIAATRAYLDTMHANDYLVKR
ncbi:nuclear transport factor 2 family protein [Pseudonocardia kujensis]|uniref:nuclear transport factor 2 family protein n=1 Tax=Pseudonocardia kujensis TaxID=1128675 RepID=UPI001E5B42BE|nr:nuclear transport factor 2 family protein [Pseudonocardia kujensis]MCE0763304.1 nuclear transport factor 2 family protein [Pseudonocardia kujensis]